MAPSTAINPSDGPIAITGASGYIGAWAVQDCLQQGFTVRACVRDKSAAKKVDHLLALDEKGYRGTLELHEADLRKPGSYDAPFKGCAGVIHAGAALGFNSETPQEIYDMCFTENTHVIESINRSGTVRRVAFTSSFAAVHLPKPQGYVFTERDYCDSMQEQGWRTRDKIPTVRDTAYALGKVESERLFTKAAAASGGAWEAYIINPVEVIGPMMCENHNQPGSWHNKVLRMLRGKNIANAKHAGDRYGRKLWNCVDVRDVARAHRLCLVVPNVDNGSRYLLSAADRSGELCTWQLQAHMQRMFPHLAVAGELPGDDGNYKPTFDAPRAYCFRAKQELGLVTYPVEETIRANCESCIALGLVKQAPPVKAASVWFGDPVGPTTAVPKSMQRGAAAKL